MNAVAFSGTGGDRLLVLGGSYTTSSSYGGSSNAIVAKLNEYVDATAPDPAQTTLQVNGGSSATVSVGVNATIVVTVKLASGTAVSGAVVSLSASPSNIASISPATSTTNGTGQATFTVQGASAGTVTYNAIASANGTTTTSSGSVAVTYVGVRNAAQSTASVPAGVAGAATPVVVTVRDGGGSLVTGAASALAVTIGGTNAGAVPSAITDQGNGAYAFTYTPTVAGTDTVAIRLDGTAISGSPYSSVVSAAPVPLAITTATLPTPVIGVAYNQTVAISGGTAPVSFSISAGTLPAGLALNTATGAITGTATTPGAYSFTVRATDALSVTATQAYSGTIGAGISITTAALPTPVLSIAYNQTVATSGGTAPVTFSVSVGSLPAGLVINTATGAITGTPTTPGAYSFTVTVADANGVTANQAYAGTINAALAITTATLPTPVIGVAYNQTVATSGGTAPVTFSVSAGALPAGVSLNTSTGTITGTPTTPGAYSFTIMVTDANNLTAAQTYSGTIGAGLAITTTTLPTPVIGVAYNQTVATSGGTAPVTFSVSAGALPAGLSLNAATGAITGTSTTPGAYSFTITATDAHSLTATQAYSGTIGAGLAITTATLPTPVIGVSYSQTVATSGGTAPVTFSVSAGALPAGLSLNAATGVISGTATTPGAYSFTITATDAHSLTAAQAYSGTIGAGLAINTAILPTPVIGVAYSQTVATSGGTAPVSFSISAGALPAGLTLNATAGTITGAPTTPGVYNFTVTATDAHGLTAAQSYSGAIVAAVAITTASLPTPVMGVAYSQTVSTSGGTAPVSFSVSAGGLPTGLAINAATGAITGTPAAAGAYSFTVTATDANGVTASQTYSGVIGAGLAITTATLPTPVIGVTYSQAIATSGGTAPVTFSVSAGALPAGVSLNTSTGAITGTPTTPGAYSFTIMVTDAHSLTATQTYSGTIGAGLAITTTTLPTPVIGVAYSQAVATSGGTAPVTFSVSAGALPAGLSLNTSTGVISGTATTPGGYSFTITATDAHSLTATQAYSGTIGAGLAITTATLPTPVIGVSYSQTVATSGGTAPVSFAVSAGALPAGLSLNTSTGMISGTATTPGAYSFTITATDAHSLTATQAYSGAIGAAAPSAAALSIEASYESAGVSVTLSSSDPAASFELSDAPTHGRVSLNGAVVTYVPTAEYIGADRFSYTAVGATGRSSPAEVSVTVLPPPPPTAESAADQTIAGEGEAANSTSTKTVSTATIDLGSLIKGLATSAQIVSPPRHGVVSLQSNASAYVAGKAGSAAISGGTAKAAPSFVAVYTPDKGFIGKDVFSFVAVGPGGTSAPAFVNIEVTPQAPTAKPITVTSIGGRPVSISLTADTGQLIRATLVSKPAATAGDTQMIEGGVAGDRTYTLQFRPNPAFEGVATIVYTLSNAAGTSDPLTITITVAARANPALDPQVRGLTGAETETARRFAGAQLDNFRGRLETIRNGGQGGPGLRLVAGVAQAQEPFEARRDREPDLASPVSSAEPTAGDSAQRRPWGSTRQVTPWVGGSIAIGNRDPQSGQAKLKISSSGLSAGLDAPLSEVLTVGVGVGVGRDDTKAGSNGSRLQADSWAAAAYASYRPADGLFVDGVLGVGRLDYDLRRYVTATGGFADGERDGRLVFGSVAGGIDRTSGVWRWSSYGRVEALRADLKAFEERGPDLYSLSYSKRAISSLLGVVGGTVEFDRRLAGGVLTPHGRFELQHDFMDADPQTVHYQDWLAGPGYSVQADGWARTRVTLTVGAGLHLDNGWTFTVDLGGEFGEGQRLGAIRIGAGSQF